MISTVFEGDSVERGKKKEKKREKWKKEDYGKDKEEGIKEEHFTLPNVVSFFLLPTFASAAFFICFVFLFNYHFGDSK